MTDKLIRKTSYKKNRGAALMMTIILIGIILVFAFSLLLVSYTLYASQNKRAASMKCSEAGNSLSVALEDELTSSNAYKNSTLWKYIRCNALIDTQTWPYYDPDDTTGDHGEKEAFRYFDLVQNANYKDPVEGLPGSTKLCIYWTPSDDTLNQLRSNTKGFDELSMAERDGAYLYIRIITESAGQTYVITNKYKVNISELDVVNNSDDKKMSDDIRKITTTTYGTSDDENKGYIYNPLKLSSTEEWGTANQPIKLREKWVITFEMRE